MGGFDAFPAEELIRDALGDDFLEVPDAFGLDALALGLLGLLLEAEFVLERFLFLLELLLKKLCQTHFYL